MSDRRAGFAWYELLTTNTSAARDFYGRVFGWSAQDVSTAAFSYTVLSADDAEIAGLMELPPDARRAGATPRWVGYVAVDDIDSAAARLKDLGGSILLPPSDSNIGRVSIVADPQTATFGLVGGLRRGGGDGAPEQAGRVGWHELFAGDVGKSFAFYSALFGWESAAPGSGHVDSYLLLKAGGRTLGGMFNKLERTPIPFWLYYFNVPDMDVAIGAVKAGGGRVMDGPFDLADSGWWITRCSDPQGGLFALQGKREGSPAEAPEAAELRWASRWGDFASQGKVIKR